MALQSFHLPQDQYWMMVRTFRPGYGGDGDDAVTDRQLHLQG
jgi:hypothetical protein